MKTLTLLRHAKSSWDIPARADFDRPLNARGARAAPLMGRFMAKNGIAPDVVLCSSAVRTRQTLDFILPGMRRPKETRILDALYEADAAALLPFVRAMPDPLSQALLIGHNPGLEDLAANLADPESSDQEALGRMKKKFPTAGLAHFIFDADVWRDIAPGAGKLIIFVTPAMLEKE